MKSNLRYLLIFLTLSMGLKAQLPKWIVGSSEQTATGGSFHPYGPGNLNFYELNFTGALSSTQRTVGTSIQNIKSLGTQDVMQTAVDTITNTVLFYAFAAAVGPYNGGFPAIQPDTIYFAAYNSTTHADEIIGKVPTDGWGASVLESELVKKPGSTTEYYFIYKTQALSTSLDNIKYVTIDASAQTVSVPNYIVTSTHSGEGMAVSQLNCTNQRWLYVTRPEPNGDITLRRCVINNAGISTPTDIYTISIPGNSTSVVAGLEIAPTNNYLAIANFNNNTVSKNMILFDYNNTTGVVSNERAYTNQSTYDFVTMEFSPNGSRVYIMQGGSGGFPNVVYNCPVMNSNYTVTSADLMTGFTLNESLTLELAYDGNIYIDPGQSSNFMYVINNPNSAAANVTTTTSNFFGANQFMGSGFPDQVDGDRNSSNGTLTASITSTDTIICAGQTTTLTASGGTNYQWSGGSTATNSLIAVSPVQTNTYVVTVSNGACTGKDSVVIKVDATPTVTVNGNQSICAGQTTTLTASGATSYIWSGGSTANTSSIAVNPTSTTNYTVIPSNGSCPGNPIAITVTVTPSPVINITTSTATICAGQTVTLTASGGTNYQWSGGSNAAANPITVSPVTTSTYVVNSSNGICVWTDSVVISIVNTLTLSLSSYTVCNGQSVNINPTVSGGTSPYTYNWNGGYNGSTYTTTPVADSAYSLMITDANGCVTPVTTGNLDVLPPLQVVVNGLNTCTVDSIALQANTSGGNGNYTYTWSPSGSHKNPLMLLPQGTTIYTVSVSDGCTINNASDTAQVVITSAPIINLPNAISGCKPVCLNLTNIPYTTLSNWQWSFGDGGSLNSQKPDYCYNKPGTYNISFTYTTTLGCVQTVSSNSVVTVLPFPNAAFSASTFSTDIFNPNINFYNESSGNITNQWSFGDLATSVIQSPSHVYANIGEYPVMLIVKNQQGCIDTVIHEVIINDVYTFYAPNAFTPNQDNFNEVFLPVGTGWENGTFKMLIFDRWGNEILNTTNPNQGWDGKVKGQLAQEDTYVWKVQLKDIFEKSHSYSGIVSIIR